jgi:hypothetical protein
VGILEIQQGLQVFCRYKNHITTATPIAARRSPRRHVLLPPKRDNPIATLPGFHFNFSSIDKLHDYSFVLSHES